MSTGLRVVLVFIGLLILAGIFWDIFRFRKRRFHRKALSLKDPTKEPKWGKGSSTPFNTELDSELNSELDSDLDVGLVLKADPKIEGLESIAETVAPIPEQAELRTEPQEVIALIVMARQPGIFLGKKLLEVFNELDLYYGDLEIFHRHEHPDGSGKPLFSVASAIEPGFFDFNNMNTLITPGLTLFFMPERRNQSIATFELMLRTAKLLAQRLDGELRDQDRRPLTLASIEKYRECARRIQGALVG